MGDFKLTGFSVGGFKAFNEPQHIPLKPITLIFGPNSAGKSTILQSLAFLREYYRTGDPDVHFINLDGTIIDLGGKKQFSYKNKINNTFSLLNLECNNENKFKINVINRPMDYDYPYSLINYSPSKFYIEERDNFKTKIVTSNLSINEMDCIIEKTINDNINFYINKVTGEVSLTPSSFPNFVYSIINNRLKIHENYLLYIIEQKFINDHNSGYEVFGDWETIFDNFKNDDILDFELILNLLNLYVDSLSIKYYNKIGYKIINIYNEEYKKCYDKIIEDYHNIISKNRIDYLMNHYIKNFNEYIENFINIFNFQKIIKFSSIGPLRTIPSRESLNSRILNSNTTATGLQAWKRILDDDIIRVKVNTWLGKEDFLGTPYKFVVQQFINTAGLDTLHDKDESKFLENLETHLKEHASPPQLSLIDVNSGTVVGTQDVGVGINQVLPVLVAAYGEKEKIVAIEQPEIHIHPKLQADLADVFIESALGENKNTFLLETHSEHLILRILRRIRESNENRLPEGMSKITPDDVAVLYVDPGPNGSKVLEIPITLNGDFAEPWPHGFFDDRAVELL